MIAGLTLEAAREAQACIRPYLHRTPLVRSAYLSERCGTEIWLKLENQQKTGSFKPRGALVTMLALPAEALKRGVITISAGNHAQGVAFAARELGVKATVVMPASASKLKAEAAAGYGAEVILHGDVHQAFEKLEQLRVERGLALVHPFDSTGAILGQSTLALEILDALPEVTTIVAGIGGGGLASGIAFGAHALESAAAVWGVEPTGADSMSRSLREGRAVRLERTSTIADGLAAPFAGELNYQVCRDQLEGVALVEDAEIVAGMRVLFERVKTVAEPAGAAALGALLAGKIDVARGSKVVAVVSGGNVSVADFARLVGGA